MTGPSADAPPPAKAPVPTPQAIVDSLVGLMSLERLEVDLFRGSQPKGRLMRVFGGQVIAQGLMAAGSTVDEPRPAHSLHAYFIRPGDPKVPIVYQVSRDRDGRSFTTRRVVAVQHGKPILNMAASFHIREPGKTHQFEMPDVPPPESLISEQEVLQQHAEHVAPERRAAIYARPPIEFRPVDPVLPSASGPRPPRQSYWIRAIAPLPDGDLLHRALLAHASDMSLLTNALLPHGLHWYKSTMQEASLDHALWLHDDVRMDDWLLYTQDSPWSGGARGMNRGLIYARDGRLVASVAQEGLIRVPTGG